MVANVSWSLGTFYTHGSLSFLETLATIHEWNEQVIMVANVCRKLADIDNIICSSQSFLANTSANDSYNKQMNGSLATAG